MKQKKEVLNSLKEVEGLSTTFFETDKQSCSVIYYNKINLPNLITSHYIGTNYYKPIARILTEKINQDE